MYDIPAAFWTAGAKHWDMAGTEISFDTFFPQIRDKINVLGMCSRKEINRRRNIKHLV